MVALPGAALLKPVRASTILPAVTYGSTVVLCLAVRKGLSRKEGSFDLGRLELPVAICPPVWTLGALFVLVTPAEALAPVLIVAGLLPDRTASPRALEGAARGRRTVTSPRPASRVLRPLLRSPDGEAPGGLLLAPSLEVDHLGGCAVRVHFGPGRPVVPGHPSGAWLSRRHEQE